jgi:exo-beta-1,3-glucanase (GH17 family)
MRGVHRVSAARPVWRRTGGVLFAAVALVSVAACGGARGGVGGGASGAEAAFAREEPFVVRPFEPYSGSRWIGDAIAYGPYRDGQSPDGPAPTRAQVREDLHLMSKRWRLLRTYGAVGPPQTMLEVIREDGLDMRVMLGVWIAPEERRDTSGAVVEALPGARDGNRREIEAAVRLAAAYPQIVLAICVGNETQVAWSDHRVSPERLIAYVREVRARTGVPVTTADDYNFWNKSPSREVADEVDFIVMHAHPLWNGVRLEEALAWTRETFDAIRAAHPDREVVLGETGWATSVHGEGEQARLIKGRAGEDEQAVFHAALTAWARGSRVPTFFFEAFDENWKGGPHPDEIEKHWGLYHVDRTPKKAMAHEG